MSQQDEVKTLEPDAALALWRQGREAWNAWVAENPDCYVSFSWVDFAQEVDDDMSISFEGYRFPKGFVRFDNATFGGGYVIFDDATFGDGDVYFGYATFGDWNVSFYNATFGDGHVIFEDVTFGDGDVNFDNATFGDGDVIFDNATFGDGDVNFNDATFGDGDLSFNDATFGGCGLHFQGSNLTKTNLYFSPSSKEYDVLPLCFLDFSKMNIGGFLSLGEFKTNCVIDLTATKMGHPVQLDKTTIGFQKEKDATLPEKNKIYGWGPFRYQKAEREDASRCFRILKKYAEDAKDHERKLAFFANEMRSDYGYGLKGAKLYLYLLYDKISDYGRSFIRPAMGLLASTLLFSAIYLAVSLTHSSHKPAVFSGAAIMNDAQSLFGDAFVLAAAHTVPFTFGSRAASKEAMTYLFDGVCHSGAIWMHGVTMVRGVISTIFLFLMGLALRNFFRS